jgi:hypothetical protein
MLAAVRIFRISSIHLLELINGQTSHDTMDPEVRRELDLVEHLVIASKDADVLFTLYLTKCQRKKINKTAGYQTCSMGPPPSPSKWSFFYWNIWGIGNFDSQIALADFYHNYKPF